MTLLFNAIKFSAERSAIALNAQCTTEGAETLTTAVLIAGTCFLHSADRSAIALSAH